MLIVDEVGELLGDSDVLNGQARQTCINFLLPLIQMLSEQEPGGLSPRFFVIISGSKSVASYVVARHLQRTQFSLQMFNSVHSMP